MCHGPADLRTYEHEGNKTDIPAPRLGTCKCLSQHEVSAHTSMGYITFVLKVWTTLGTSVHPK